jgi:hypothetical protein
MTTEIWSVSCDDLNTFLERARALPEGKKLAEGGTVRVEPNGDVFFDLEVEPTGGQQS